MTEISIIIPTHNRAGKLHACLLALAGQTLPASDFEVIVVVDGSTDETGEMLASLSVPFQLKVFHQSTSGQCAALNRGLAEAVSRFCLILDDDVVPTPPLAAEHLAAQLKYGGVMAIGQLTLLLPAAADCFAQNLVRVWNNHYIRLNGELRSPTWSDAYSGNLSVPRQAILDAGGFAIDLPAGFDIELAYRLHCQGVPVVYVSLAIGLHDDYKDFRRIAADMEKHGRATVEISRRHPATLPVLLGNFCETTLKALWLRRLLLALNISSRLLRLVSHVAENRSWEFGWYYFLHSYFYWRGVRQATPDRETWRRLTSTTPILMYHAFAGPGESASRYVISARRFGLQMAWLKLLRYHVLSLEDYLNERQLYHLPPAHSVVLTIDDGYAEIATLAYPILRRHGFPASIFLVTSQVGGANQWDGDGPLAGRLLLGWPDIHEMQRGGLIFGAHTRTHLRLTSVSPATAQAEVAGSKADLENELAVPARLFAYPFGANDQAAQAAVQEAGFLGACSVRRGQNGLNTPLFSLKRIEVFGTDCIVRFALTLWLGDDRLPRRETAPPDHDFQLK